jgi:hypothetical protein
MKKLVFLVCFIFIFGSCFAQSVNNDAQRIIGTWVSEVSEVGNITVVFNADGTGTWNGEHFYYGISASGRIYLTRQQNEFGLFISPDGRRWIFGRIVFQKR